MKKFLYAILAVFIVVILAGCNAESTTIEPISAAGDIAPTSSKEIATVFFIKNGYLVPVSFSIDAHIAQPDLIIKTLFSESTPKGFENKLANTRVNSFEINGDTVSIDVSSEAFQGDKAYLAENQIIYTLTEYDNIYKVNITVAGKPYRTQQARPPFINLKNPEEYSKDKENPEELAKYLKIYYADQAKEYLVPITVKSDKLKVKAENDSGSSKIKTEEKARAALLHLIEGAGKIKGLELLDGKMIKSLKIDDGIAVIDLDCLYITKFSNETRYAEIAVECVVRTLTSIDGIEKVQFLVGGVQRGYVTGNININNPIEPSKWFNVLEN